MRIAFVLLGAVLLACTASSQPDAPREVDGMAGVDTLHARFVAAYNARNAAQLAELYELNATLVGSSGAVIDGRPAIQDVYSRTLPVFRDFSMTRQRAEVTGGLAYERGMYTQTITSPDRTPESVQGTYLFVAHRSGTGWLILAHTVSRDAEGR